MPVSKVTATFVSLFAHIDPLDVNEAVRVFDEKLYRVSLSGETGAVQSVTEKCRQPKSFDLSYKG
ncbi:MAG: hypothetical protein WC335_02655 [Candidatus Omnitrophota bacterium]|jgi:hypothetical protein